MLRAFVLAVSLLAGAGLGSEFRSPRYREGPRHIIIVEEAYNCCFRRLFAGKKVAPHSIRRSMPVVSAQECEQACLTERQFSCEGFNLRVDYRGLGRGSCELTDVPANKLGDSLLRNFIEDQEFDYFARQGGSPQCGPANSGPDNRVPGGPGGSTGGNSFYSPQGGSRPQIGYGNQGHQRPPTFGAPQGSGGHQSGAGNYGGGGNPGNWQLFSSSQYGANNNQNNLNQVQPFRPSGYGPQPQGGLSGIPPPYKGSGWSNRPNNQNTGIGFYGGSSGGGYRPLPPPPPPPSSFGPSNGPYAGHQGGRGPGSPPWNTNDDECFARVWSGQRLDKLAIRSTSNHPNLGGCQLQCLQAREFVCRAFSYRHGPPGAPGDSCILTDRPLQELHPREGVVPDQDFEIYERILGGRGCEHIAPFPPSTPWGSMPPGQPFNSIRDGGADPLPPLLTKPLPGVHERPNLAGPAGQDCYAEYWPSARLAANAVTVATHAPSLPECLSRCTNSQHQWNTPCRSVAFRSGVHGHNCLLSELAQRDLRPNMDFLHDEEKSAMDGWRLMAWDWSDERCRLPGSVSFAGSGSNSLVPWDGDRDKNNNWMGNGYRPQTGSYGSSGSYGGSSGSLGGGSGLYGGGNGGNGGAGNIQNNQIGGGYGGGAMAFTVSGKPCARGQVCRMDPNAEFWSCPLDPGSGKDWDYCCSPTHRCGYSEGMQMPWCYVGMTKLQWRPCSEKYWPYQNSRIDDREGRFLPVAYLHKSGPPGHEGPINATHYEKVTPNFVTNATSTTPITTEKKMEELKDDSSEMIPVELTEVHAVI